MKKYLLLLIVGFYSSFPVAADTMGIVISNQTKVWVHLTLDVVGPGNNYIFVRVPPNSSRWFETFDVTPKNVSAWTYTPIDDVHNERVVVINQPIGDVETAVIRIKPTPAGGAYQLSMYYDVWDDFINNIISHGAIHYYFGWNGPKRNEVHVL